MIAFNSVDEAGSPGATDRRRCRRIERRVIARLEGEDGHQRWSPDSTQIAYAERASDGDYDTYVYDLATGETRFVTAGRIESWVDNDRILVS